MAVDIETFEPKPADDARALELIAECRSRLGGEWALISASTKLTKTIFEADFSGRRVIGKASTSKKSKAAYEHMRELFSAGMKSPSEFTVPEPIAWFEDLGLLVLEKAPGASVLESMQHRESAIKPALRAAEWLHALNASHAHLEERLFDADAANRQAVELAECIEDARILEIASGATGVLKTRPNVIVATHGDYHPMNVYVAPQRVTAIDLDTTALRDPETDIGYFLAQTANFGLQMFDSFEATRELRDRFRSCFPQADERRVVAHIAWALLRSLHYDVCILKIDNKHAGRMIDTARAVLV
jgi:aminoglycoside phosphotransferase